MKVKARHITMMDVEVSDEEMGATLRRIFREKFGIDPSYELEAGKFYRDVEYHTSHSWSEREFVKDATEIDISAWETLQILRQSFPMRS